MQTAPDGTITLQPVKVVPMVQEEAPAFVSASANHEQWARDNATEIDQYNAWAEQREPYAQRVRRWRAEQQK